MAPRHLKLHKSRIILHSQLCGRWIIEICFFFHPLELPRSCALLEMLCKLRMFHMSENSIQHTTCTVTDWHRALCTTSIIRTFVLASRAGKIVSFFHDYPRPPSRHSDVRSDVWMTTPAVCSNGSARAYNFKSGIVKI